MFNNIFIEKLKDIPWFSRSVLQNVRDKAVKRCSVLSRKIVLVNRPVAVALVLLLNTFVQIRALNMIAIVNLLDSGIRGGGDLSFE